ncbi:MAG: GGDEF domain-containing protein [Xanthomonadaceae bacterium]|nr:GGDEF domain-containing protein [Xanthomonadaceae bacterium]
MQLRQSNTVPGSWPVVLLCAWLLAMLAVPSWGQDQTTSGSVRQQLDQARVVSYTEHWQDAQAILDELGPQLDAFELPEFVDFHLLEARHLVLADRSLEALERATMLLERPLKDDQRLRVLQFMANTGVLLRDYETAFDSLLNALQIEPRVDDPVAGISTYNMAAYMFGKVGEHERAMQYGQEAISRALTAGETNEECVARQRVAPVYKWADQPEQSETQYRRGIAACSKIGNQLFVGVLQHGLADLLRAQGRLEEARKLAIASIGVLQDSVYPLGEHEARLVLAETLYDLGAITPEVRAGFTAVADYFRTMGLWDQTARMDRLLARIAEDRGELRRALDHYRRHLDAREQFLDRDRAMRLAYLEIEFDTRLKDRQIDLLEESARVAHVEATTANQQRRLRSIILLLSIFVALLLAILLINAFRGRRYFRQLSRHDTLSGLANQGWFLERAASLLEEATRQGASAYLVMADVDHFKRINDEFGHLSGDQVLGQVARRLREAFGAPALIGRVGGEEFAVLIIADHIAPAIDGIETFQQQPAGSSRADDPAVTLSFGISRYRQGENLEMLRKRADEALYQAKREGRNRYVISPEARDDRDHP